LYVVEVRLVNTVTGERIKHKLLMVGSEAPDIERKLKWIFDGTMYKEFSIASIEKVREKVHFLSTVITQDKSPSGPVVKQVDGSKSVNQSVAAVPTAYAPKLYAIGITTTMVAADEAHCMRKVGHALISHAIEGRSHTGASLSEDSTIAIEEIPRANAYATVRDVSNEINKASFVQG
jgi:hypothetical protein